MTCSSNFFVNCEELRQSPVSSNVIGSDYRKQRRDIPELFLIQDETEYFKVLLNRIGRIGDERVSKIAEGRFVQMWGGMHLGRDKTSAFPSKAHPSGPCIPGARKLFMDVQGNFFPCESTSEASRCMRIGSVDSGFDVPQIAKLLNVGKITEEECKSCWGFRLCRQCCMAADGLDDLSRKKRLAMCGKMLRANENNMKD